MLIFKTHNLHCKFNILNFSTGEDHSMKMKASICTRYGSADALQLQEIDKPVPKANEVLVKIHASNTTAADSMMRQGKPYYGRLFLGLTKPKFPITGTGFAGTIEAMGNEVSNFQLENAVFGESILGSGTNTEYVCVPDNGLIMLKPENLTFGQASTLCDGALTSINMLQNLAKIKSGDKVLINGASGSLGSTGIQIAKQLGAHVTGVCSASNTKMVKDLGADDVIDYQQQDFTSNKNHYDIIYDSIGKRSYSECKKALKENGRYVSPVLGLPLLGQVLWTSFLNKLRTRAKQGKSAHFAPTGLLPPTELKILLTQLMPMIEAEKLTPIIECSYPLDDIAVAHKHVDSGRKKGNVIIQ
jgi:NADPH:quinone reductase-like Zn-dependent oxidoreductase